jgi:hypothetical protein
VWDLFLRVELNWYLECDKDADRFSNPPVTGGLEAYCAAKKPKRVVCETENHARMRPCAHAPFAHKQNVKMLPAKYRASLLIKHELGIGYSRSCNLLMNRSFSNLLSPNWPREYIV